MAVVAIVEVMVGAVVETDDLEALHGPGLPLFGGHPGENRGQSHVHQRAHHRQQVVGLENIAQLEAAHRRQLLRAQRG